MRAFLFALMVPCIAWGQSTNTMPAGTLVPANSSVAPLDNEESFVGGWTGVYEYSSITVKVLTDQNADLQIEFSDDCETETNDLDFRVFANIPEVHQLAITSQCFRVSLNNDSGSNQTVLDLQSIAGYQGLLTAPSNLGLARDADALATRPTDYETEIALGLRPGISKFNKFAFRSDLDTEDGDALIIADNTTNSLTILQSASTFTIAYNSSTDGLGTTGATELTFFYIDANGDKAVFAHTLGDDGSDITSFSGLGINRIAVSASGSNDTNGSGITVTATTGSSVQSFLAAGTSVTEQAFFFNVSNGISLIEYVFINVRKLSGGSSPRVTIIGTVYSRAVDTAYEVVRINIDTSVENTISLFDPIPFTLNPQDVIYFTASTNTNNTAVNIRFSAVTVEDE